jgi:hypothetical protein
VATTGRATETRTARRGESFWSRLRRLFFGIAEPFSTDRA